MIATRNQLSTKTFTGLQMLDRARQALEHVRTIDDVTPLISVAEAARVVFKKAKAGVETLNLAAEVKLKCERKAGELLGSKIARGRTAPLKTHDVSLAELGIKKHQSRRWQMIASVSDEAFDEHVERFKESERELTTASVLKLANRQPTIQEPAAVQMTGAETVNDLALLEGRKFGTIYADPPWQYGNQATRASTDGHYDTMTVPEIAAMPVGALAAEQSHIHLWTTNAFLFEARTVMESWGFEYKSCYVWVKTQMGIGNYWRLSHEFLLLGIRGDLRVPAEKRMRSWDEYPRTKHSRKPEAVRHKVEQISPGPYLELFGRQAIVGWTVYGNQVRQDKTLFKR